MRKEYSDAEISLILKLGFSILMCIDERFGFAGRLTAIFESVLRWDSYST